MKKLLASLLALALAGLPAAAQELGQAPQAAVPEAPAVSGPAALPQASLPVIPALPAPAAPAAASVEASAPAQAPVSALAQAEHAAGPARQSQRFAQGRARFDGALPETPAYEPVAEYPRVSAAESLRRAAPLRLADYRPPAKLKRHQRLYRGAQLAAFSTAGTIAVLGAGLLPAFYAFIAGCLAFRLIAGMMDPLGGRTDKSVPAQGRIKETVEALSRRLNLPVTPEVVIDDAGGPHNAAAGGSLHGPRPRIGFGSGWRSDDQRQLAFVAAHELGHIVNDDRFVLFAGIEHSLPAYMGVLTAWATAAMISPMLRGVWTPAFPHLAGPAMAAAAALCAAGIAFANLEARQMEKRADHFGVWATHPAWAQAFFKRYGPRTEIPEATFLRALVDPHPSDGRRLRAAQAQDGRR